MANVDDIHAFQKGFAAALKRIDESEISDHNKEIIKKFIVFCNGQEISTSTCTIYLNSLHRIAIKVKKNLDEMAESDYEFLLLNLKSKGYKEGYIYQYKKTIKKFFKWRFDLDVPRWVARIQLKATDTPVQPSDLITKDEIDKLYQACNNPREKALIAVLLDSGMRIGALGSLRIKNIEFNQFGAILYLSKTSQSNKSTVAKGIPITWSTGHLNQWLAMHPNKDNPEAPLWVNLKGRDRGKAMSYNTIRKALKDVGERSGVNGNFTDQEINKSIYAHYGLTAEDKSTKLERCPRCHTVLVQGARMCHQCALVLDAGLEKELKVGQDHAQKALLKMMESPEVRALLKEMMNK